MSNSKTFFLEGGVYPQTVFLRGSTDTSLNPGIEYVALFAIPHGTLKIGDYCHAHRWSDSDPFDPFAVGFLKEIRVSKEGNFYLLEGEGVPERWFPHCEKITEQEGRDLLARNPAKAGQP